MKKLAFLALTLLSVIRALSQATIDVSGTVYDSAGTPIAHASVSFYSETVTVFQCVQSATRSRAPAPPSCLPSTLFTTVADNKGRYSLANVKANRYIAVVNVAIGEQRGWWGQEVLVNASGEARDLSQDSNHAIK